MFPAIRLALAGFTPGRGLHSKAGSHCQNRRLCLIAPNDVLVPKGIIVRGSAINSASYFLVPQFLTFLTLAPVSMRNVVSTFAMSIGSIMPKRMGALCHVEACFEEE
jgi:hypothetical protein